MAWFQNLSEKLKTNISLRFRRESYLADYENPNIALEGKNQSLFSFSLGAAHKLTRRFSFFESLTVSQEIFDKGLSNGQGVKLTTAILPQFNVGSSVDLLELNPYVFFGDIQASLVGPGKAVGYSTKLGYGYGGRLGIRQSFKSSAQLSAALFYQDHAFNSSIVAIRKQDLGILFSYSWKFGQ